MNWNTEDPLFQDLFRFAWFLYGSREAAMHALEKAFQKLSGKPEAAERERAARFLFNHLRRGAPKPTKKTEAAPAGAEPPVCRLQRLPEPERSLIGLFFATTLPAADISRILGHPQADLAARLCLLRRKIAPADLAQSAANLSARPASQELQCAFERVSTNAQDASAQQGGGNSLSRAVDEFWRAEFERMEPREEESRILSDWANHLQTRATAWRPSPRDPAMIGLACGLLLLIGIAVWTVLGSSESITGRPKVVAILEEGVGAAASEYEPVSGSLGELGDWLALQGLDGAFFPQGFPQQKAIAARIFSFENAKVASVLLPEAEMVIFLFDAGLLDVGVQPVGEWKVFSQGRDTAAIIQQGSHAFMVAMRGSQEELEQQLEAISGL